MATADCVTQHRAFIYDRGGISRFAEITDINFVRWTRDRDAISEAEVHITSTSCENQRSLVNQIAAKRHELVIFRGDQRVWEGPIWRIGDEGDAIKIYAKDVLAYLDGRALSRVWDNSYAGDGATELTTRFEKIIEYELTTNRTVRLVYGGTVNMEAWENLDPPANILPHLTTHHFPNEARTSAKTFASEMTIGEHLANAAQYSGIDYCAVGRAIHIWDTSRNIGRTRTLTEADFFGPIIITEYGADHTQAAYVTGGDSVYGEAALTENLDFYGPWETVYTAFNEEGAEGPTQGELNSQAARNVLGRTPVPFEVRIPDNSSVRLSESLSINDLVPGVHVPLRANLNARKREALQKIDHVTVTETSEGEDVQLTLVPAARPDSDIVITENNPVTATFPNNNNYILRVSAQTDGTTVLISALVYEKNRSRTAPGIEDEDRPWSITMEISDGVNSTKTGTWDYEFQYYWRKRAASYEFLNVGLGMRDFSATVDMGSAGSLTLNGRVEIT